MYSTLALTFSIIAGALAQLSLKAGLSVNATNPLNAQVLLGLFLYLSAMISWIVALKTFELGYAYPLLSLGYILVYIGAFYWPGLEESITWNKSIGLALIVAGVTVCANADSFTWSRYEKSQ